MSFTKVVSDSKELDSKLGVRENEGLKELSVASPPPPSSLLIGSPQVSNFV